MPLNLGTPSDNTAKVNVKMVNHSTGWQPQFSSDNGDNNGDNWHTGPIKWSPAKGSDTSLVITFVMGANVKDLKPTDPPSPNLTLGPLDNGQQTCTVKATGAQDRFLIERKDGGTHDPQIVVTPIT